MRSAITVCLVPEAIHGPFVYHCGIEEGCRRAAALGFDAVEIFPRTAETIDVQLLRQSLDQNSLQLAAMGTGAGWLTQQLSLTSSDAEVVRRGQNFIRSVIDLAGQFGAPAIIGSMQGRVPTAEKREATLDLLAQSLEPLADHAAQYNAPLLYEPLNRYETNIFCTLDSTAQWLRSLKTKNLRILADMFHMNIEESDLVESIRKAGNLIGHVHFADSNRRAVGMGHTPAKQFVDALREIGYQGYLSAEVFPVPDSDRAAAQTIQAFFACVDKQQPTS
jgi:sugar phosphate isomerase/epimerase